MAKATAKEVADSKRLRDNLKTLNLEYAKAKKQGIDAVNFYKTARVQIEQISGSYSKRGVGNLGKASQSKERERQLLELTDKLLESKWATEKGREQIYRKSFETAKANAKGLTQTQWLTMIDVFQNETFQKIAEITKLESDQVRKALVKSGRKEKGQSLEEFIEKRFYKDVSKLNNMTAEEQRVYWAEHLDRWSNRDTTKIARR